MSPLSISAGLVRPRVIMSGAGDPLPLDDVVRDIAAAGVDSVVWIIGGPGSGKSVALEYLAGAFDDGGSFEGGHSLLLLDEPKEIPATDRLVVATTSRQPSAEGIELRLTPWVRDDLVEYLLARHHDSCGSVIARLGDSARRSWVPEVARAVLDELASDESLPSAAEACFAHFERVCTDRQLGLAVSRCLAQLSGDKLQVLSTAAGFDKHPLNRHMINLLRYQEVREWLVAWYIAGQLEHQRSEDELHWRWPADLLDEVARRCSGNPAVIEHLERLLSGRRHGKKASMAASLMLRLDPSWRPSTQPRNTWRLEHAQLSGAYWPQVDLSKALLNGCTFSGANLQGSLLGRAKAQSARFDNAHLVDLQAHGFRAHGTSFVHSDLSGAHLDNSSLRDADFTGANLRSASLMGAICRGANFIGACLREANLQGTDLLLCQWRDADLNSADLSGAQLRRADFREARLDFVQFDLANLEKAQFDGLTITEPCFKNARLQQADFTASTLIAPDFWHADLSGARLAEIDWRSADLRGADLRGATFHMGSSRSGLVNSPIAMEGSMTGFYTEDLEQLHFKRPEEVRKAALCGADLRGAKIKGVDFYLVDLRGARLDPAALQQARQTGAILDDWQR